MHLTFSALSDPTRLNIMAVLSDGPRPVGDLVEATSLKGATISKHLDVLERGDLVIRKREGNRRICHINPVGLRAAYEWLATYEEFWVGALDRLGAAMDGQDATRSNKKNEGEA